MVGTHGMRKESNVLLVTAHPDDECMFFTPTMSSLAASGARLSLLCLSTGTFVSEMRVNYEPVRTSVS